MDVQSGKITDEKETNFIINKILYDYKNTNINTQK